MITSHQKLTLKPMQNTMVFYGTIPETIDKFANKNLFEKVDGEWKPL